MIEEVRVLSARRAYEFGGDDLRLTVLSLQPMVQTLQAAFRFQIAQVGQPMPTFGTIPGTIPPGIVFDYGLWTSQTGSSVPIRFLHLEPRRIVIDIQGPSSDIGSVYERLRAVVLEVVQALNMDATPPLIGEPQRTLEYSELVATCSWPLDAIFAPAIRPLLRGAAGLGESEQHVVLAPSVFAQLQPAHQESAGAVTTVDSRTLQLAPRLGTRFEQQVHFSGALLTTDAHFDYLRALDEALSGAAAAPDPHKKHSKTSAGTSPAADAS